MSYMLVHYRGKRYFLELPQSPGEINQDDFRVDTTNPPPILKPGEVPIDDLRLLCFQHNIRLNWALKEKTFSTDEILSLTLVEAAEIFINSRHSPNTAQSYRQALDNLLKFKVFRKNYSLKKALNLEEIQELVHDKISHSPSSAQLCANFLMALLKYWDEQLSPPPPEVNTTPGSLRRRLYPKNVVMTPIEYAKFLPSLQAIHPKHSLIAEILWAVNHYLSNPEAPLKNCTIIPLESVLHMRRYDVLSNGMIELFRQEQPKKLLYVPMSIPRELSQLTGQPEDFLFAQKNGSPYKRQQINASFKKASTHAGLLKIISPGMLRPALLPIKKVI